MATPSFFFAIFKKLQICEPGITYFNATNPAAGGLAGHFASPDTPMASGGLSGGFCLWYPSHPNGIFGTILPSQAWTPDLAGQSPLVIGNTTPKENPLYVILNTCAASNPPTGENGVPVDGSSALWPPMPDFCNVHATPGTDANLAWLVFNSAAFPGVPTLVEALGEWIKNGQVNDEPKGPLYFPVLNNVQSLPAVFPGLPANTSILFMCSMPGDNGRRPGDHGTPPAAPIPADYWATSQIFLTDETGNPQPPSTSLFVGNSNQEYYVAAAIGNSGNINAGQWPVSQAAQPSLNVVCYAMAFNTYFSPPVQLPSLSPLDGNTTDMVYEQFFLAKQCYDVVGFRFNVNSAFNALVLALEGVDLGYLSAEEWLENGHVCIKVYITSGEMQNNFPPNPPATTIASNPQTDRHIAQKNLGGFVVGGSTPPIKWIYFILAQAPLNAAVVNRLQIRHDLPPESFRFLLAMPTRPFDNYLNTGDLRGFEVVRDVPSKPFPDAVILRETVRGSFLEIASHAREPFFGMSLGIECDSTRLPHGSVGAVSVVHFANDDDVVGGFTIEVETDDVRQ